MGGSGGRVEGGQAGCERRIEVFVIIHFFFFFGGGGVRGIRIGGGRVGGVRVDVKEELKFL